MNSNLIIFEGPDNVGKTTQISYLLKQLMDNPTYVLHFSVIKNITSEQALNYNKKLYADLFYFINNAFLNNRNIILDRSWLGDYVYGSLYRQYDTQYIFEIEEKYKEFICFKNIKLILLIDKPENLIKRDDNNSFSIDLKLKQKEIDLFEEVKEKSLLLEKNKLKIDINNKLIEDINKEIITFLNL